MNDIVIFWGFLIISIYLYFQKIVLSLYLNMKYGKAIDHEDAEQKFFDFTNVTTDYLLPDNLKISFLKFSLGNVIICEYHKKKFYIASYPIFHLKKFIEYSYKVSPNFEELLFYLKLLN